MAVEWTITIEGRSEFGNTCRKEVHIDKSWARLFDGDIGLPIDDGKVFGFKIICDAEQLKPES